MLSGASPEPRPEPGAVPSVFFSRRMVSEWRTFLSSLHFYSAPVHGEVLTRARRGSLWDVDGDRGCVCGPSTATLSLGGPKVFQRATRSKPGLDAPPHFLCGAAKRQGGGRGS